MDGEKEGEKYGEKEIFNNHSTPTPHSQGVSEGVRVVLIRMRTEEGVGRS